MRKHIAAALFIMGTATLFLGSAPQTSAATLSLESGKVHEGFAIVREFDETVVTLLTPMTRIYQFPAAKVKSVSGTIENILAEDTAMKAAPKESAKTVIQLTAGQEVRNLTDENKPGGKLDAAFEEKDGWVKVKAWGENTGWVPKKLLTDLVVRNEKGQFEKPAAKK